MAPCTAVSTIPQRCFASSISGPATESGSSTRWMGCPVPRRSDARHIPRVSSARPGESDKHGPTRRLTTLLSGRIPIRAGAPCVVWATTGSLGASAGAGSDRWNHAVTTDSVDPGSSAITAISHQWMAKAFANWESAPARPSPCVLSREPRRPRAARLPVLSVACRVDLSPHRDRD